MHTRATKHPWCSTGTGDDFTAADYRPRPRPLSTSICRGGREIETLYCWRPSLLSSPCSHIVFSLESFPAIHIECFNLGVVSECSAWKSVCPKVYACFRPFPHRRIRRQTLGDLRHSCDVCLDLGHGGMRHRRVYRREGRVPPRWRRGDRREGRESESQRGEKTAWRS